MRWAAGVVGWRQLRCSGRLTPQLLILRLMTLGFWRTRRVGSGSARISAIACWWAVVMVRGGKPGLRAGGAASGAEASDERQSVGDEIGMQGGVVHHAPDRVVRAEVPVGFLVDAVGRL